MTGYDRTGFCNILAPDSGTHTVCAELTDDFLEFTRSEGNSLPGLKAGDHWCLCALRWRGAHEAGKAPNMKLASTNKRTLDFVDIETLENYKE